MVTQGLIDVFFKEYVFGFIYNDIDRAIKDAKANFLVALGLSVYTEVIGGLITGHLHDSGWSKRNYQAFLPFLGPEYVELDKKIDLYRRVRCGLVHEYFIKGPHAMIAVKFDDSKYPGIVYTEKLDHITIAVEHYFRDFKSGVQKYHSSLKSGDKQAVHNFQDVTRKK